MEGNQSLPMRLFAIFILLPQILYAQQSFTIVKRFNQHKFEDRQFGVRDDCLDAKDGTNFFNQYELVQSHGAWPQSLNTAYVTNFYIWSYINANGQFVVTESVQWFNIPNSLQLILINQPLPAGITPRYPYPHIGTNTIATTYTITEDKGSSLLLIARSMNPVPGLPYDKPWYYRLNCYNSLTSAEYHTGVALGAGGTRLVCIAQLDLMDSANHFFTGSGFFDGAYSVSPVEYLPLNPTHTVTSQLSYPDNYSAPAIPSRHYISEIYIPSYFNIPH